MQAALNGSSVVVATPTASGKSLAYTVPILDRLSTTRAARAILLFPLKALANDQLAGGVM
jgi:DEAD/DEAH box helicase domain-containing protein